jgi:hypothetical protein
MRIAEKTRVFCDVLHNPEDSSLRGTPFYIEP